jgi:hypothetical protein
MLLHHMALIVQKLFISGCTHDLSAQVLVTPHFGLVLLYYTPNLFFFYPQQCLKRLELSPKSCRIQIARRTKFRYHSQTLSWTRQGLTRALPKFGIPPSMAKKNVFSPFFLG